LIKAQYNSLKQDVEQFSLRSINILILFGIRRNCLRNGRSRSLYLSIRRAIKQIVVITQAYHFCPTTYKILPNIPLSKLTQYTEVSIGDDQCGFQNNKSTTAFV
jgi:hypothetical protein